MKYYNIYASCGKDAFVRKNMQRKEFMTCLAVLEKFPQFNKYVVVIKNELVL